MGIRPRSVRGEVGAPPSKSYTHRALVVGHLSRRRYRVLHPLDSEDTRATAKAIEVLGSRVRRSADEWVVSPGPDREGTAPCSIDCGESGTTLRFASALAAASGRRVRLSGRGRLPGRPMAPLWRALGAMGARTRSLGARGKTLPVTIEGPIDGADVAVEASESSQFASALLLIAPVLERPTVLRLEGRVVSEPYLDATLSVLASSRIHVRRSGRRFEVEGRQRYQGRRFAVPGDASSAAYLWTAGALAGGPVRVRGIPRDRPQADLAVLDLFRASGAVVREGRRGISVSAGARHRPFSIDLTRAPDLYPLAGVLAAATPGRCRLRGAPHIVLKESDRRAGTERLVAALGGRCRRTRSGLEIEGRAELPGFVLEHEDDHRLVMSAAVAALAASSPSRLGDADAVRKSFPGFWRALVALGAEGPRR